MRDEKRQIVDQEDVIVVGSDVTLGELLASEYHPYPGKSVG